MREKEARSAKGRANIWIKVTFNNFLEWKSLPSTFSIKRTWNRYSNQPVDIFPGNVTSSTIGRFLNKISFHYIPAIRGREIFLYYLKLLHDSLIEDEEAGIKNASDKLIDSINKSTTIMSQQIQENLQLNSNIQVPNDLKDLFAALDFSTEFSGYNIPLQKRGDGLQARHIPFILDFIAKKSNKNHILAYEEPENSLELGKAFELAEQLNGHLSQENQIFITTHSPAFYDLSGDTVSKWLVQLNQYTSDKEFKTNLFSLNDISFPDEILGITGLISSRAKELYNEVEILNTEKNKLNEQIKNAKKPQLLVEGYSDRDILIKSFNMLYPTDEMPFDIIYSNGYKNISLCLKYLSLFSSNVTEAIIGLLDYEQNCHQEIKKHYKKCRRVNDYFREVDKHKKIYIGTLPLSNDFEEIQKQLNKNSIFDLPISIEYIFPPDLINHAINKNIISVIERTGNVQNDELKFPINLSQHLAKYLPSQYKYLAYKINDNDSSKKYFSKYINKLNKKKYFYNFDKIFSKIQNLITN